MRLLEFKISRYHEIIKGIYISESNDWYYIQNNIVDYVLDGYKILNKKFIREIKEVREDCFDWKVLNIKYKSYHNQMPINDYLTTFSYLQKENKLIGLGLESEKFILVGKIKTINNKSFAFDKIGTNTQHLEVETIRYDNIRFISIDTDYLNSLELYIAQSKYL